MVLLFWCRLTQVVLEKRSLNECSVQIQAKNIQVKPETITTTITTVLRPFVWDYLGEPVPEEIFTHSH